jgi:integrase
MPRPRPRSTRLETRTARLRLTVRGKPYDYTSVTPGVQLGYRRNKKPPGVWVMQASDGHGVTWIKNIGHADDCEDSDGKPILSYFEACDRARELARGGDDTGRPVTVHDALTDYQADLVAKGGAIGNVSRVRHHLTPALAAKPVGLLTAGELTRWRNGLLGKGLASSTVLRTVKILGAALNLAARHHRGITNREDWRVGLGGLTDTYNVRDAVLPDRDVQAVVACAYALGAHFGLYVEVHATTGARPSQIAKLLTVDLQADRDCPRLLMPASRKGRKNRDGSKRVSVPISRGLAGKLSAAAAGRPASAPLLVRPDGQPWQPQHGDHSRLFAQAAEQAGCKGHTIYSLRHSSIVRSLLAGVPARLTAVAHDTSIVMLERTYSHYIADHADEITRRGLLEFAS